MGDFPNVTAWHELTDATLAADPDLGPRLGAALTTLGMTSPEKDELLSSLEGRQDPAAVLLVRVAAFAGPSTEPWVPPAPATVAEMDAALSAAETLRSTLAPALARGPVELSSVPAMPAALARALSPDRAGELAIELLELCPAQGTERDRLSALRAFVVHTRDLDTARMPVARLVRAGIRVRAGLPPEYPGVADLLARVRTPRLLSGLALAIAEGADPAAILAVVEHVARLRSRGSTPVTGRVESTRTSVPPPAASLPPEEPLGSPPGRLPRRTKSSAGGVFGRIAKRWRSALPMGGDPHEGPLEERVDDLAAGTPSESAHPEGDGGAGADHPAYPRIDVSTGTGRSDVVVVEQEFLVTVGLGRRRDHTLTSTGVLTVSAEELIDVVLVFDPHSLATTAPTRQTLRVTAADPYPSVTLPFVASYIDAELPVERRIGVHYVRQGQVVGIAWRTVVAVNSVAEVAGAAPATTRDHRLINLSPLLDETPPDLVVGICAADGADGRRLVWTVYPGVDGEAALDGPRSAPMDDTAAGFAKALRFKIQFGSDPDALYQELAGAGATLGRIVPASVRSVIRAVVEDATRPVAPTILLLTEELHLPWELVTFQPPLVSSWGGDAPFLGAHAAIGRWPLSEGEPRPVPRPTVEVVKAAVLSAKYDGVTKWGKLDDAEAEAAEVTELFGAVSVPPTIRAVADLFGGTPAAQLVHVALHGQFDTEGTAEGLVLLAVDAAGTQTAKATFFSPLAAENGHLAAGPFVFLNACQVGADRAVLGDYGGFASTLLRIGATGVVAPLWNVDDDVAAAMAREFYAATWSAPADERVSVAEAVRRARARYTVEGVTQRVPGVSPTLVAFQCLAHPQLRLTGA
ncbi:CHAT domain-containing protein [Knoellia locipacati]|uniref:CHAT domain-containing protein n=1 Tax=Knoellia locipacati TaxID=882824 RepID=UPI00384FEB81